MSQVDPKEHSALSKEEARWLIRHVLPHELALRKWLSLNRIPGLEIDDIVQETYAKLIQTANLNIVDSPKLYMFITARSILISHVRRSKVVSFKALADVDHLRLHFDAPNPEEQVADRDELSRFAEAIATLPGKIGRAFVLRRVQGYSLKETAQRLGLSESTVEKHLRKALILLFERFARGGYAGQPMSRVNAERFISSHVQTTNQQD
ncbi:MAG TPA: RNA polymerase sigma factor [Caulobacteraceae bacterium]|nr:RNA polymerase sigma factor [Caulobacteraceae bacterium]